MRADGASKKMSVFLLNATRLVILQEGVKVQELVKHSKNEFAKGQIHLNEIVNF